LITRSSEWESSGSVHGRGARGRERRAPVAVAIAAVYLVTEHRAIVDGFESADLTAVRTAIRTHIETGQRIALEAIERAGGVL
jgi:DNA-binding GntR family transcriptional regulator